MVNFDIQRLTLCKWEDYSNNFYVFLQQQSLSNCIHRGTIIDGLKVSKTKFLLNKSSEALRLIITALFRLGFMQKMWRRRNILSRIVQPPQRWEWHFLGIGLSLPINWLPQTWRKYSIFSRCYNYNYLFFSYYYINELDTTKAQHEA